MIRRLTLPAPPSTNSLYTRTWKGGVGKSKAYHQWRQDAMWLHKQEHKKPLRLKHCWVEVDAGIDYRRDCDNLLKPVLDLLESVGEIQNDRYVESVQVRRDKTIKKDHVTVAWSDRGL